MNLKERINLLAAKTVENAEEVQKIISELEAIENEALDRASALGEAWKILRTNGLSTTEIEEKEEELYTLAVEAQRARSDFAKKFAQLRIAEVREAQYEDNRKTGKASRRLA